MKALNFIVPAFILLFIACNNKKKKEAAHYVSKILKGAKPGDLPVKHPEKYYLTLNTTSQRK